MMIQKKAPPATEQDTRAHKMGRQVQGTKIVGTGQSKSPAPAKALVSLVTSEKPSKLAKLFYLGTNGELKRKSAGSLVRGEYQRIEAGTPTP